MNIGPSLLTACEKRDPHAQLKVYALLFPVLFNSAMGILKNKLQAEDVAQDTILTVFSKLATLESKEKFKSWAKRIAINKSLNLLKKENKLNLEPLSEESPYYRDNENEEESLLWREVQLKYLHKAMDELPVGYSSILHLYLIEEFDHSTIGRMMGIAASTSRSQYTRAKQKLKNIIETKYAGFIEREI